MHSSAQSGTNAAAIIATMSTADLLALAHALAVAVYPDPEPFTTAEAFARAAHADIPTLADEELTDHRMLALFRRAVERAAHPRRDDTPRSEWLRGRIARLDAESAGRRARAKRGRPR